MQLFANARLFLPGSFAAGSFSVRGERFERFFPDAFPNQADHMPRVDLRGATVLPGLVDIHTHGNSGADCSDGSPEGLRTMAAYLARHGVTSFAPTTMTLPYEALSAAFAAIRKLYDSRPEDCARVAGIHMEGPFLSNAKRGAQSAAYLRSPDAAAFRALSEGCGGLIRLVDVAAELEGAAAFAALASKLCTVSVAHTDADYEQAGSVFDAGARHLTHLFNAMPPLLHRAPGVIGAASEREAVTAELICDGLHVHPSAVRAAFRLFPGRICLISDALRCCGMPDGAYELGGQTVVLNHGAARLADGTLAGAAVHLLDGLRNAVRFGIPEAEAVRAATLLPARVIGMEREIGSLERGKFADFLVCDREYRLKSVYLGGRKLL